MKKTDAEHTDMTIAKIEKSMKELDEIVTEKLGAKVSNPYLKDAKPLPKSKAGKFKVTNPKSVGLVPKVSIASLKEEVDSLRGHNAQQRVEIVKLEGDKSKSVRSANVSKLINDNLESSLATSDGIIAERNKTIDNLTVENDLNLIRVNSLLDESENNRGIDAPGAKRQIQLMKHRKYLIVASVLLSIALAATLTIWRVLG